MDKLIALEKTVSDDLRVYRYQPAELPDLPAIWNWVGGGTFSIVDQMRWRDQVEILVRLGLQHTDVDQDMEKIETYTDDFREVIDDALYNIKVGPLQGAAVRGSRTAFRNIGIAFNDIPVLCMEFPITFDIDRRIVPNQ